MCRFRAYDKRIILVQTIDLRRDKMDNGIKQSQGLSPWRQKQPRGLSPWMGEGGALWTR